MKSIAWRPGLTLPHDPNDQEIYRWDLSRWLDGDTVAASPQVLSDAGITAVLETVGTDYVDVRISGGTAGVTYGVTVRTTSSPRGRVVDRTVRFAVAER